ncbi:hypothetical protein DFJ73DRAFT_260218 [Zopfochytrium polystomum]|nr:hypothetical protein DFJ73DRAFT_260218 [Zopfochytrium polystomum]
MEVQSVVNEAQAWLSARFELNESSPHGPVPWDWVASKLLDLFYEFPSGVTRAVLVSELEWRWHLRRSGGDARIVESQRYTTRARLKSSPTGLIEANLISITTIADTGVRVATLTNGSSTDTSERSSSLEAIVHPKFCRFIDEGIYQNLFRGNRRFVWVSDVTDRGQRRRLVPTETVLPILSWANSSDRQFIQSHCEEVNFSSHSQQLARNSLLLLHLESINSAEESRLGDDGANYRCRVISLREPLSGTEVKLQLPGDARPIELKYDESTILFLVAGFDQENSYSTVTDAGKPYGSGPSTICLFGRVRSLSRHSVDDEVLDAFRLSLEDGPSITNVLLYGAAAHSCKRLVEGDVVFIENLTVQELPGGGHLALGQPDSETHIRCITTLAAILNSPFLCPRTPLSRASAAPEFHCKAFIVACENLHFESEVICHRDCYREAYFREDNRLFCDFCVQAGVDGIYMCSLVLTLDDGMGKIQALASFGVAEVCIYHEHVVVESCGPSTLLQVLLGEDIGRLEQLARDSYSVLLNREYAFWIVSQPNYDRFLVRAVVACG